MNKKSILLSAFALIIAGSVMAQDKIYKRNGDVIDAKVQEINARTITYKRSDNASGPNYVIDKSNVDKIEYQNGSEDVMNEDRRAEPRVVKHDKTKYGNNIISLSPLQITQGEGDGDGPGVGIALSYERILDRKGILSFYLPLTWTFMDGNEEPFGSSYYGGRYNDNHSAFFACPGLKIYPTGSRGKVRYAVGPSIAIGIGKRWVEQPYNPGPYYPGPYYPVGYYGDHFTLGMMVNNSLNINPTAHLSLGLELGLGVSYINQVDGRNVGEDALVQFGFKIGYRF